MWFTHCLEYLVVFNTDPSTSVSIRFCILIMYKMCSYYYYYHFFFVILRIGVCLECGMFFV